jgi:hypothetical protein
MVSCYSACSKTFFRDDQQGFNIICSEDHIPNGGSLEIMSSGIFTLNHDVLTVFLWDFDFGELSRAASLSENLIKTETPY